MPNSGPTSGHGFRWAGLFALARFQARRLLVRQALVWAAIATGLLALAAAQGPPGLKLDLSPGWLATRVLTPAMSLWWLLLVIPMAQLGRRLASGEAGFFAPTGMPPSQFAVAMWMGSALASGVMVAGILLVVASLPGRGSATLRIVRTLPAGGDRSLEVETSLHTPELSLQIEPGDRLGIWVQPSYGQAQTTWAVMRTPGGIRPEEATPIQVDGLRLLQTQLPPGPLQAGAIVSNLGPGNLGVFGTRGLWWLRPQGAFAFHWNLWLRLWGICLWLAAIALCAGAWLRPTFAVPLTAALALALSMGSPNWLLGGLQTLRPALQGVASSSPSGMSAVVLVITIGIALWSASKGLRVWGLNR